MEETWKHIAGYEGKYKVSNFGRIMSLRDNKGKYRKKILKTRNNRGYRRIGLRRFSKQKSKSVHRIVANAFIGLRPSNMQINHKNGIKDDNRLENLEWVTPKENVKHSIKVLGNSQKGEKNGNAKLSNIEVAEIRAMIARGTTGVEIADLFNITSTAIYDIRSGKRWGHIQC